MCRPCCYCRYSWVFKTFQQFYPFFDYTSFILSLLYLLVIQNDLIYHHQKTDKFKTIEHLIAIQILLVLLFTLSVLFVMPGFGLFTPSVFLIACSSYFFISFITCLSYFFMFFMARSFAFLYLLRLVSHALLFLVLFYVFCDLSTSLCFFGSFRLYFL